MLSTHCFMRISSPKSTWGMDGSTSMLSLSPLSSALLRTIFIRSLIVELNSYSTGMISILPASILEKSSRSFIRLKRVFPEFLISAAYLSISISLLSLRIISSMPRTALMGVLISCETLDRKVDFASDEALATRRSSLSCCSRFISSI